MALTWAQGKRKKKEIKRDTYQLRDEFATLGPNVL